MKYHLVGISGIGMSALAILLKGLGHKVSGSTKEKNEICNFLEKEGIEIFFPHKKENIKKDIDFLVYSTAIKKDHIELKEAKRKNIEILHRSDALNDIINLHKKNILITGTHGKTTTTSLISYIFFKANRNFSTYIGGLVPFLNYKNAKLDKNKNIIISEIDESDKSFLKYSPYFLLITNIDKDHLDFYKNENDIKNSFLKVIRKTNTNGKIFLSLKNSFLNKNFLKNIKRKFVYITSYRDYKENESFFKKLKYLDYVISYEKDKNNLVSIYKNNKKILEFFPTLSGEHNLINASLAIACALENKISKKVIKEALETFQNAKRRLEVIYKDLERNIFILDDYAHHPKELEAVILALKEKYPNKNIILIFQPHRYSRFYKLYEEFKKVLKKYKNEINIFLTPIFPAGEENIYKVDIFKLAKDLNLKVIDYLKDPENIRNIPIFSNSVYITVGAGNIYQLAYKLRDYLKKVLTKKN